MPSFLPSFPSEVGAMKIMISISCFSFLVNCLMEEDEHNNGERKKRKTEGSSDTKQKTTNALSAGSCK
jgi:hypothetical protein